MTFNALLKFLTAFFVAGASSAKASEASNKNEQKMTLEQMYKQLGGDYNDVRLRIPSETLIRRFAVKFLSDTTFKDLTDGIAAGDWEKAFRAAHTMKGVALNLGFGTLCRTSSELTEALRSREPLQDMALFEAVKSAYAEAVDAIKAI